MTVDRQPAPLSRAEEEAVQWLSRLREDPRRHQTAFEDWYSASTENADAYDRTVGSWETAGGITKEQASMFGSRRVWGYALAAVAAAVALFMIVGGARSPAGVGPGPDREQAIAAVTKVGEIRTIALDDGSKVTLDTQSAIRASLDPAKRQIQLLRGRARFDIATETRPFIITTDTGTVTSGGGVLDVASIDGRTEVGLRRGTAGLQSLNRSAVPFQIAPGMRVVARRDGTIAPPERMGMSDGRWTAGMLSFEDTPLATVLATANRYSDTQIVLTDAKLETLRFTGTIKATDTLGLARMIAAMFNLKLGTSNPQRLTLSP